MQRVGSRRKMFLTKDVHRLCLVRFFPSRVQRRPFQGLFATREPQNSRISKWMMQATG